jgi:hypothetical protein
MRKLRRGQVQNVLPMTGVSGTGLEGGDAGSSQGDRRSIDSCVSSQGSTVLTYPKKSLCHLCSAETKASERANEENASPVHSHPCWWGAGKDVPCLVLEDRTIRKGTSLISCHLSSQSST